MPEEIKQIQQKITPLLKSAGVVRAAVFGSVARGENTPESDVDILVEVRRPYGLFKFIGIKHQLEDVLGKKVDLVEYESIKPGIKENIMKDQIQIL